MWKTKKLELLNEQPEPRLGCGISRPFPNQSVRSYALTVVVPKSRPMRVTLLAPSKAHAIKYAKNRWPGADVEVTK